MFNPTIQRIKKLEVEIQELTKFIDDGEANAAGLRIDIGIGKEQRDVLDIEIGLDSDKVLEALRTALTKSLQYAVSDLQKEITEAAVFLEQRRKS